MKKKFVSMLLLSCMLFNTTIVNANQVSLDPSGVGSGSTPSNFSVTAEILGGCDLVVTIPDQLILAESGDNFYKLDKVNVKGAINPAKVVNVSTPVEIEFEHEEDESIVAAGTISFGEGGVNQYTAQDLQAAGASGIDKNLSCTVPKSEVEYVGTYKSSIVFDIELADKASTTYYMGYDYVESSELDPITDDDTIDYDTYAQTDTVAVLREFSTNKADIYSKGYNKVVSSNSSTLTIPEQLDTYDVAQIDFSTFFSNSKISSLVTRVEVPATVTGIELAENTESTSTAVIICANDRASVSLAEKLPSNVQLQFKEQSSGGGGAIPDEGEVSEAGLYDASGNLLCTWNESGIDVTANYTYDTYNTSKTSPYYVLTRNYTAATQVILPSDVTSIGKCAFYDCSGLTSVTIPNSVTTIGRSAFNGCSGLTSVTIPNSVTSIGDGVFEVCTGLTSVTIPNSVTKIGECAFDGCSSLTSITIPDSVTSIGIRAFDGCKGLTSITIPDSVTWIGHSAFRNCPRLTSVTIPNSITCIDYMAFCGCSGLKSVTIPNSVTSIEAYAFGCCSSLTSITIPDSVTSIGGNAFEECTHLTSVTIPDSVTSIGRNAFEECTHLTSVTIPNSVTWIGEDAFSKCDALTVINYSGTQSQLNAIDITADSGGTKLSGKTIHCTDGDVVLE